MVADLPDYYALLQVHPNADFEVIEAAYRRLARKYHPDLSSVADAEAKMGQLNAAHEILSNPQKRRDYDAARESAWPVGRVDEAVGVEPRPREQTVKVAWWRCLLVLPAAILGFIIAQIIALLIGAYLPDKVSQIVSSFMTPIGFVILGTWAVPVKRPLIAGILTVVMLVFHGIFWGIALFSGQIAFLSVAAVASIAGSLLGFYIAQGRGLRRRTGVALFSLLSVGKSAVGLAIFLGIAIAIWWPIIKAVVGSPLWSVLLIPLGLFLSGLAFFIQSLIYNILVFPLVLLTRWLLKEESR